MDKFTSIPITEQQAGTAADSRHRLAKEFDFSSLTVKPSPTEFFELGHMSPLKNVRPASSLAPEKLALIAERARIEDNGSAWKSVEELGITSQDIMALISNGTQTPAPDLSRQIDAWWQERAADPLWQQQDTHEPVPSAQQQYDIDKHRQKIRRLAEELQISERDQPRLLRLDKFSRGTVYIRDYAAIPRLLRALFKMVPYCICTPHHREELAPFVKYAVRHRIPLTPRGRGTWALGGAVATKGGLILDLAGFEKSISVDPQKMTATVSCSVDFQSLEESLNTYGLTLPLRPSNKYALIAGFCSVGDPEKGGMGLLAFSGGHIGDLVEEIEVVTGEGEIRHFTSAHPDFKFFFGTNGRHGVITRLTLRVVEKPEHYIPLALQFSSFRQTLDFAQRLCADIHQGTVEFSPLHIEAFSADYLKALHHAEPAVTPASNGKTESNGLPERDTLLIVFTSPSAAHAFESYALAFAAGAVLDRQAGAILWDERFSPLKLRRSGDVLTSEIVLPLDQVGNYLDELVPFAQKLGVQLLPICHVLKNGDALLVPQFLTDRRRRFQYYRHFSLVPVLARRAVKHYRGRPYGFGIWMAGLFKTVYGREKGRAYKNAKRRFDPASVLNPGKLTEIRSRVFNVLGRLLLSEWSIALLDLTLKTQSLLGRLRFVLRTVLKAATLPYRRENFDAMHRCVKCSACFVCPLAQVWQKSGDPKLQADAIFITPRLKMEYMQRHIFEGKKLSQADVDRFALCLRCGVAEREHVCPISDMLLEVKPSGDGKLVQIQRHATQLKGESPVVESTPCKKEFPTYDAFEQRLRDEGYDVDGAIQRYMDILKSHPGVARAMQEVLGKYRVPKHGDLVVLNPKTDFAIYKVDVDQDKCINCGKCGDEHTTSQRGFWDPRHPRNMVSLDDLIRELHGRIPLSWFRELGGPIPDFLKTQGFVQKGFVQLPVPSPLDAGHHHCNGCLYCVIECPVDAIRVRLNPYYENLAGRDFTHFDIRRINEESRTGEVPTSGTGATGLFGGRGFDRYMFDFSVIVRPTRDGIREAIDIGVNLGRKPLFHLFEKKGNGREHIVTQFPTVDLATPLLLELPSMQMDDAVTMAAVFARAAAREGTLCLLTLPEFLNALEQIGTYADCLALKLTGADLSIFEKLITLPEGRRALTILQSIKLVLLRVHDAPLSVDEHEAKLALLRRVFSPEVHLGVYLEIPAGDSPSRPGGIARTVLELARAGNGIIYLRCAFDDALGYYPSADVVPACYDELYRHGAHSQVTLLANGIKSPADLGISMMLGATAGVIDRTAVVAINYEFPMLEKSGLPLPAFDEEIALHRVQNLFKSWHKQIREVLGAFGMRDIRRTVGERGRLIDLRERAKIMQAIVADADLRAKSRRVNEEKIQEDGALARQASWKYSELEKLIQPVTAPNYNLLGERKESLESMLAARGDRRWTADILAATWEIASGSVPSHKVAQTGNDFGPGSFDSIEFAPVEFDGLHMSLAEAVDVVEARAVPPGRDAEVRRALDDISISAGVVTRHQRPTTPPRVNAYPIDGADMSLGSIGWKLTLARYLAGMILRRYTGTGEGGYPLEKAERLYAHFPSLSPPIVRWLCRQLEAWVATQTATGYFGVTEDTIRRASKIVLKFAQGAKPGLGGHILGPKVTLQVEDMRGVIAGISVFSPFPFHDVYSIEDVTKMIEWLRTINPDAIICVKISTPVDVYHVALGLTTAGADEIQIDATAGGTGAAPDIARNRIAMPLEFALADTHKFLVEQGERNKVILVASGGLRSAYDIAKAFILGADKVVLGTQEIVADQCNRCGNCESPGGCQKGITTTVPQLEEQKDIALNAQWVVNAQASVMLHVIKMLHVWGIRDIRELRGRTDLIARWGWEVESGREGEWERWRAEDREQCVSSKLQEAVNEKQRTTNNGQQTTKEKYDDRDVDACGVVSFACTRPVPVESIQTACQRMHNRGNGRGGGVLALGGMFPAVHRNHYAMQVNVLCAAEKRHELMAEIFDKYFGDLHVFDREGKIIDIHLKGDCRLDELERFRNPRVQKNGRDITYQEAGLAVDPGDIFRFFVRVTPEALLRFAKDTLLVCRNDHAQSVIHNPQSINIVGKWIDYYIKYSELLTKEFLAHIDPQSDFQNQPAAKPFWTDLEDEFIYRRSFAINQDYYITPQAEKRNPEAYVASMIKDGAIWKLVGYAEQASNYWLVTDAEYRPFSDLERTLDGTHVKGEERQTLQDYLARYRLKSPCGRGDAVNGDLTPLAPQIKLIHQEGQLTIHISERQIVIPQQGDRFVVNYQTGAHVWIGHQRFPTVFSPYSGGSHPFYGRINEALIHNGDFANYVAMVRFWDQFGGAPQFRTDTEMAAKAFGILKQMAYPTTHLIEAIAPTTGLDFARLQQLDPRLAADFAAIQKSQIAGSPDGPWFFIIADHLPEQKTYRMLGITDTSVLRPSVFVWIKSSAPERWASIGLIGSEEQACRSVLDALYRRGILPTREPDRVTIIRGGSVDAEANGQPTGGGAIIYSLRDEASESREGDGERGREGERRSGRNGEKRGSLNLTLDIRDKFGNELFTPGGQHADLAAAIIEDDEVRQWRDLVFADDGAPKFDNAQAFLRKMRELLADCTFNSFRWFVSACVNLAENDSRRWLLIASLTLLRDQIEAINVGDKKRSSLVQILNDGLDTIFDGIEKIGSSTLDRTYYRITRAEYQQIIPPPRRGERERGRLGEWEKGGMGERANASNQQPATSDQHPATSNCWLVIDATGFPPEGHDSLARTVVGAYEKGWRQFIVYRQTGQRYLGSGLGPRAEEVEIHLYGNSGQDLANSMMGGTLMVHGDAQNDMGKILHSGTVVVHGLAGNTGIYGAKGGTVLIRKSTGIRWVINSVSSPSGPGLKVVIVGTAMEYLAESLMGGTVVVLGLDWNEHGQLVRMLRPYAGGSLLAGASAGKVIIYDPFNEIQPAQYPNAVEIGFLTKDWQEKIAHLKKLIAARYTTAEWLQSLERWKGYLDFGLRDAAWLTADKLAAINELVTFAKSWITEADAQAAEKLRHFVEFRFRDNEWRRLVRMLAQVFPKNSWAEGIEYLERLRDWQEMRELLLLADQHFGLGLEAHGDEFLLPADDRQTGIETGLSPFGGQRVSFGRKDFKVIRPMTTKEKEAETHRQKEWQYSTEKQRRAERRALTPNEAQARLKSLQEVFKI